MDDFEVPPLRSLQDFLLESARFSSPAVHDPQRFTNRLVDNLLYYQTNYFLTAVIMFLLVGFMNPKSMMLGMVTMAVIIAAFVYFSNNKRETQKFKTQHPFLCGIGILFAASLLMYLFGSILVFVWGIMLPIAAILLHAAFRMRNLKNKVSKKLESLGIKRTPMGVILFELGLEDQARS
ncbi:PRA1 family protein 3 [Holothuria leucospilota]|uniref:PRA1 family protein n=1 Tax=Holothuria leucospilota TaxID=206669 RepID=A0A9Q1HFG6_HOLLE|nr:PRA1 family protein 3 [Holothuria leucospilota]